MSDPITGVGAVVGLRDQQEAAAVTSTAPGGTGSWAGRLPVPIAPRSTGPQPFITQPAITQPLPKPRSRPA